MGRITAEDRFVIKTLRQEKNWGARRIVTEFPNKQWKTSTVSDLLRKIDATGDVKRKPGSGRPRTKRTPANIQLVEDMICSQEEPGTHATPRVIARNTHLSRSTVQRIAKLDLNLHVYKRFPVQQLTEDNKAKRLDCCNRLLQRFPNPRSTRRIWFTDEKLFPVAPPTNTQNNRVYSAATRKRQVHPTRLLFQRPHFSKSVMVSVGVSKMGKTNVVFVEPGETITSKYYCQAVLQEGHFPNIQRICGHHSWVLQQDGAPSHRAANTVAFLNALGVNFIEPTLWPPNSPDLNPVDYAIWGALEQKVYRHLIKNVDDLRTAISYEWQRMSLRMINRSIDEWRTRLQQVVHNNGGHIEHSFH